MDETLLVHYRIDDNEYIEKEIKQALLDNKCKVCRYCEDYYELPSEEGEDSITIKQVVNCEHLFGYFPLNLNESDYWMIKKGENGELSYIMKEGKDSYSSPSSEKVVRFNVIEFEIFRNEHHSTIYEIVFSNGWFKQYCIVSSEKFSSNTPEQYKFNIINELKDNGQLCMSKFLQYKEHFHNHNVGMSVSKFRPTVDLIECLIESFTKQCDKVLSIEQIECLVTLCQQISLLTRKDFNEIDMKLEDFSQKYRNDLFNVILNDRWNEDHNSIQVFTSWAFFPFHKLVQPYVMNLELVCDSPHLFRYLISCKYGNERAGYILSPIYRLEDKDSELFQLAIQCGVPLQRVFVRIEEKYPQVLLVRNRKLLESSQDPRCWYFHRKINFNVHSLPEFKKYLFGTDWYMLCLYVYGMKFKENIEIVKSILKTMNMGVYYHFLRQTTIGFSQRIEYTKKAIVHGINEDVDLINATCEDLSEKQLWGNVARLLEEDGTEFQFNY